MQELLLHSNFSTDCVRCQYKFGVRIEEIGKKGIKNPSQKAIIARSSHRSWEGPMNKGLVSQLLEHFKTTYGLKADNAE